MTALEDIKNGASVRGIVPGQPVEVVSVEWIGDQAISDDCSQHAICSMNGAAKTSEEPQDPFRDICFALLGLLQLIIICVPFSPDLRRHTVEPLWATF